MAKNNTDFGQKNDKLCTNQKAVYFQSILINPNLIVKKGKNLSQTY